jgi:predicted DNA-binding protein
MFEGVVMERKRRPTGESRGISLRLDAQLVESLDQAAKKIGITRSFLIQKILEAFESFGDLFTKPDAVDLVVERIIEKLGGALIVRKGEKGKKR